MFRRELRQLLLLQHFVCDMQKFNEHCDEFLTRINYTSRHLFIVRQNVKVTN